MDLSLYGLPNGCTVSILCINILLLLLLIVVYCLIFIYI
jgi:hypothetical protein